MGLEKVIIEWRFSWKAIMEQICKGGLYTIVRSLDFYFETKTIIKIT
jgi:hypothetical protein